MYWEVYSHHFKISIVLPSSAFISSKFQMLTKQYWLYTEWSVWSKQKILSSGSVSRFPEDPCRKIRTSGSPEGRRKAMLGHFKRPWAAVRIWKMTKTSNYTKCFECSNIQLLCKALTIRRSYSCSSCSLSLVCCLLSLLYRRWAPGPPSIDLSEDPSNSKIVLEVITSLVWLVSDR